MKKCRNVLILLYLAGFCLNGCAQHINPAQPDEIDVAQKIQGEYSNNHQLLGIYTFHCDTENARIDIIPIRGSELHLNALKFLEPPPYLYLTLESQPQFNGNILDVDIGLRNPYIGDALYTGFDVCGIVFTHGSIQVFSDPELIIAGPGETRLLNADGYTRWWNPAEFPHGNNVFSYIDGDIGTPAGQADFNCTLNGYKYFADGLGPDDPLTLLDTANRGKFSTGTKNVRHYKIDLSGGGIFNYAVDACWKKPSGDPPYNVPDDFPPGANRPEAWNLSISVIENDLYYLDEFDFAGGNLHLLIDVYDHFDAALNELSFESPSGLPLESAVAPISGGESFSTYEIDLTGELLGHNGDAALLITVKSQAIGYGGLLPGKPVCAYFFYPYAISPDAPDGWARTWGNADYYDESNSVAVGAGDIYVTGRFNGAVDFDPGPGIDIQEDGSHFLSKFNQIGKFDWARVWPAVVNDVACNSAGDVYIVGAFCNTVDFDPGPGIDEHTSSTGSDAFICKLDSSGNYIWTRTWAGGLYSDNVEAQHIDIDSSGNTYITGVFTGTCDFDPGTGTYELASNGEEDDIFLSSLDADGTFKWAGAWGSIYGDSVYGTSTNPSGQVFVTGHCGEADLDPGPGIDEHPPGTFLSKFNTSGGYEWGKTWGGGTAQVETRDVANDNYGNAYVTGRFATFIWTPPVDFDPGPGTAEYHSKGHTSDAYISKFDPSGNFLWVQTLNSLGHEDGWGIASDGLNYLYITGRFVDECFGPNGENQYSNDANGIFLSQFTLDGDYLWLRTFGSAYSDRPLGVSCDTNSNVFITGYFNWNGPAGEITDFDPGYGTDMHASLGDSDAFLCKFPDNGNW